MENLTEKASQHQKSIYFCAVSLIIASAFSTYPGVILMKFYQSNLMGFWPSRLELIPYYIVILGMSTFMTGLFGIVVTQLQNKMAWIVFSLFMSMNFLAQIGSIVMGLEIKSAIEATRIKKLMVFNACIGTILAIIELISVILACAMIRILRKMF